MREKSILSQLDMRDFERLPIIEHQVEEAGRFLELSEENGSAYRIFDPKACENQP
jgi:hypothetical protein